MNKCIQLGSRWLTTSALATVWLTTQALAQAVSAEPPAAAAAAPQAAPSSGGGATLQEVIVTAEKRQTSVQKTPMSISVVSGAELQRQGITDITAIAEQTPGISFRTTGPGQTELEMRGMSSSGGESPTVGFYLDETALTPPATAQNGKVVLDPNLFDLQRVEVLRGPQGTLYGAGSMGGTIRVITNQPNATHLSGNLQTVLSGTEGGGLNYTENGALNVPIVEDKLAMRVVGSYSHDDGWIDRVVVSPFPLESNPNCPGYYGCTRGNVSAAPVVDDHKNVNDVDRLGGRVSFLIQPTDRLTITPMVLYQRTTSGGYSLTDSNPGTNAHYQPFDVPESLSDTFQLYTLTAKYRFDLFDVTSVTSQWNRSERQSQDFSEALQDQFLLAGFTAAEGGAGPASIQEYDTTRQFSQEVRLSSSWTGPFQAIAGAYYSQYYSNSQVYAIVPGVTPLAGAANIFSLYQPTNLKQIAAFGEASYQILDTLKLTTGLRWYSYSSDTTTTQSGIATGSLTPVTNYGTASNTGFNPKFNLSYTPTNDLTLYAEAAKGFRPGASNQPVPTSGPLSCASSLAAFGLTSAPGQYQPDSVWSYELGGKARFLDRRLSVDGSVYEMDWSGVQQQVELPGCGFNYTANSGNATVRGGELEVVAAITSDLKISVNGAYTHAALDANTPSTGGVAGQQLQNIPQLTHSESITYSKPLSNGFVLETRLSNDYVGPRVDLLGRLPAYNLINLRFGLSKDQWTAHLFVNNIANNQVVLSHANSLSANLPSYTRDAVETPLTVGVDLGYRF